MLDRLWPTLTFVSDLYYCWINGRINGARYGPGQTLAIDQNLTFLADAIGGCERIFKTPIPLSYTRYHPSTPFPQRYLKVPCTATRGTVPPMPYPKGTHTHRYLAPLHGYRPCSPSARDDAGVRMTSQRTTTSVSRGTLSPVSVPCASGSGRGTLPRWYPAHPLSRPWYPVRMVPAQCLGLPPRSLGILAGCSRSNAPPEPSRESLFTARLFRWFP